MISRLGLIVLAEAALTLALIATPLLSPSGTPGATPVAASAPQPAAASQARVERPKKSAAAKTAPAKVAAAKAPPSAAAPGLSASPPAPPPATRPPAPLVAVADLPEAGGDYRKARRQLLGKGFKPANVAPPECRGPEPSVDACWGALVQFPEIETCSNGSRGFCIGWWLAPDGRVLRIQTVGETTRIGDRHWASPGELADLPMGWRP